MKRSALRFERLETRQMMYGGDLLDEGSATDSPSVDEPDLAPAEQAPPTKIFLDFGFEFPELLTLGGPTVQEFDLDLDVPAHYWGNGAVALYSPYHNGATVYAPEPANFEYLNSVRDVLKDLAIDYNDDGAINDADVLALAEDVRKLVTRSFEPFHVEVEIVSSANWHEALQVLAGSQANDVYVLIGGKYTGESALGIANRDVGNDYDDIVYVFAKDALTDVLAEGDTYYFATSLAKGVAHEAGHAFGLAHTNVGQGNAGELMDDAGGIAKLTDVTITMRGSEFDIQVTLGTQDSYAVLAEVLGAKPGGPDYVSGTAYSDKIKIQQNAFGHWWATVEVYRDSSYSTLVDSFTYQIDPTHGLLIEAGRGNDRVTVYGDIDVTIRGGKGNDVLIGGEGLNIFEGEEGTDYLYGYGAENVYRFGFGAWDLGRDYLVDLGGLSTLDFSEFRGPVSVNLGQAGAQQVGLGQAKAEIYTWSSYRIDNLIGSQFDDLLTGHSGNNLIIGLGGKNKIDGAGGRDEIYPDQRTSLDPRKADLVLSDWR
jgi:hypothetical protein